ncbi:bifunctional phosphoserine phosphatase/homoserine phosphotransferase ThrH [Puniceicoccales bacterium CK1056]|uniref:phosphoserine phosphatase n=1 Tax=Oceanipulchritudo coccoides TaxID=2706888 RepID=A0A6B2LZA7_9BACT|nr:bifunctional phosphoserine phosphatase/homoserine phosphotransferase ThrH [Oceanipulchritudo coccoides]NDV62051.1 bifunctional phosphoserine phosphatase/homoserine phosphotransferase ThrH [Oceanipulchritudo coccoides]
MDIVCLDLEGVLLPEFWIAVAEATNIPEFRRTTRDEPDYDVLMRYRLDLLDKHGLTINAIHEAIKDLEPLPGAVEFTEWLVARSRLIILSDTFVQFAEPMMAKLGHPTLFCHELEIDDAGKILNYNLRQPDQKKKAVRALQSLNFHVIAAGDSWNDLTMLQSADHGILFRPPESLQSAEPDMPVATTHDELKAAIEAAFSA